MPTPTATRASRLLEAAKDMQAELQADSDDANSVANIVVQLAEVVRDLAYQLDAARRPERGAQ